MKIIYNKWIPVKGFYAISLFGLFFNTKKAYKSIPFEREAYDNERKPTYLSKRKKFTWLQYAFKRL